MHRNQSVDTHQFAMIPRADIPRSGFRRPSSHKTTLDSGWLVPVFIDEVLPGDTFKVTATLFGRLATPIVPIMDNLYLDSFFFFVPMRLVWSNWHKFMGEQENPGDSTSFLLPTLSLGSSTVPANSLYDYFGLVGAGQLTGTLTVTSLPFRGYNRIFNEWFRDENLVNRVAQNMGDGPDSNADYVLQRRGKRHDYFTSALPWVQKGASVTLPLGSSAPVYTSVAEQPNTLTARPPIKFRNSTTGALITGSGTLGIDANSEIRYNATGITGGIGGLYPSNMYADLSAATSATINQLRQSFQIQKLLERDARGGTRLTEIIRSHFGVISPDARLQRCEYLGGGSTPININQVEQTSATGVTGGATPLGMVSAYGTMVSQGNGFTQSFTEHGYIIGLVSIRADLSYQQGVRKLWNRSTRYDFYWPVFAMLGEQAILNREIYCDGSANDTAVFGYQERWAEYRYFPSLVTGLMRSTATGTLDVWHLAQRFTALPTLNKSFIEENPPIGRITAIPTPSGKEFFLDCYFDVHTTRALPTFSVPGLVDHF